MDDSVVISDEQPAEYRLTIRIAFVLAAFSFVRSSAIADISAPAITSFTHTGQTNSFVLPPYPAAQTYTIHGGTNVNSLAPDNSFFLAARTNFSTNGSVVLTNVIYEWRTTNAASPSAFYQAQITPMSSNALLSAIVLNRLAYGPTPNDLAWTATNGPDAYISNQAAPWNLTENVGTSHTNVAFIQSKLVEATNFVYTTNANIADLRAWHVLRAVGAQRQLLEILLQFFENHFVTQWSKSENYFGNFYSDGNIEDRLAAQLEYLENENWRNALLNSQCTFYDLLKISAESPAMIIYLDTVGSRGDGKNIANENYARELMELFTMGVDNGYDQNDITTESRIWTGWRIEKVDFTNAFNPFALKTSVIIPGSTNTSITTYLESLRRLGFQLSAEVSQLLQQTHLPWQDRAPAFRTAMDHKDLRHKFHSWPV